jgi:hypothetical protein
VIQSEITAMRKDLEGEQNLIEFMQKLWKRKTGHTKILLSKREEFFSKKYKRPILEMMDAQSVYFYQKYLHPENEFLHLVKRRTTLKIDPSKLMLLEGPELVKEEEKLMTMIGIPEEKIEERQKKHIKKTQTQKLMQQ